MVVAHFGEKLDSDRVCSVPAGVCVCVLRNLSGNLAFKATRVEDTKLTLAVISF